MKFECQETCGGKCCKIPKGRQLFIFLTRPDRIRLAKFLRKPMNKFAMQSNFSSTRFGAVGIHWHLKPRDTKRYKAHETIPESKCRFLTDAGRCSVYEARPTQCRTWPFWPENMAPETQEMFMKECPGIGVGPDLPEEVVNEKLADQERADGIYTSQRG